MTPGADLRARLLSWLKLDPKPKGPFSDRAALLCLVPLGFFMFSVMVWAPWYSNFDVDTLTHFEQIRAVATHGSLGFENGPVHAHIELRTRWFVAAHGRLWGILPATMPYILALPMRLGGYRGTVRAIWAIFALGALMTYALSWRLTLHRGLSVAAAYALVTATSLGFWGTMTAPFIPASCFGITGLYFATRAFDPQRASRAWLYGLLGGLFVSVALGCHLLFTLPFLAVGAVFLVTGPLSQRFSLALAYALGSLPSLSLMGWVNHQRFGSWNPVSYGPCSSQTCETTSNDQTPSAFANLLKPVLPYVLAWALAMWLSRKSPRATGVLGFMGVAAALLPDTELRETFSRLLHAAWGFVIDLGNVNMGFNHALEGPGSFNDVWCVRSLLQCSPYLAVAALAGSSDEGSSHRDCSPEGVAHQAGLRMLWGLSLGVLVTCALRADTGGAYIWGWPFLTVRYTTPMLPALVVLAAIAARKLPLGLLHLAMVLVVGLVGARWLGAVPSDEALLRRKVLHWAPLAMALASGALLAATKLPGWRRVLSGHLAALCLALSLGWGAAQVFGLDLLATKVYRGRQTARTEELARCTPQRFILLGGYAMDEALALHDRRDIYFINLGMGVRDGSGARGLVDRALGPDRPAFLLQDELWGPWHFRWDGFEFRPMAKCPRVLQIVRSGAPG